MFGTNVGFVRGLLTILLVLVLQGCGTSALRPPQSALPSVLHGRALVLTETAADYPEADAASAVKGPGHGGVSSALVVRITEDLTVYRMWNGPGKVNSRGQTNRLGQWWSYDVPSGTQSAYRRNYDICLAWNDLTWMATCTLKAGSVVAIGPGQSVSAKTCGDETGQESYPANPAYWQTWIVRAWARPETLSCPPATQDYRADPANIAEPIR